MKEYNLVDDFKLFLFTWIICQKKWRHERRWRKDLEICFTNYRLWLIYWNESNTPKSFRQAFSYTSSLKNIKIDKKIRRNGLSPQSSLIEKWNKILSCNPDTDGDEFKPATFAFWLLTLEAPLWSPPPNRHAHLLSCLLLFCFPCFWHPLRLSVAHLLVTDTKSVTTTAVFSLFLFSRVCQYPKCNHIRIVYTRDQLLAAVGGRC